MDVSTGCGAGWAGCVATVCEGTGPGTDTMLYLALGYESIGLVDQVGWVCEDGDDADGSRRVGSTAEGEDCSRGGKGCCSFGHVRYASVSSRAALETCQLSFGSVGLVGSKGTSGAAALVLGSSASDWPSV